MPRAKCTLYDAGIETALMARWPRGGMAEGRLVSEMISNVDVLPTILEAAGVSVPERIQGRSFLPLLRGETYLPRTEIYAEKTYHSYYDPMRAIRTERFKYIRNFETSFLVEVPGDVQQGIIFPRHTALYSGSEHPPTELYDLEVAPWEQGNLTGLGRVGEIERRLASQLQTWMEQTDDPLLSGPVPSPSLRQGMEAMT